MPRLKSTANNNTPTPTTHRFSGRPITWAPKKGEPRLSLAEQLEIYLKDNPNALELDAQERNLRQKRNQPDSDVFTPEAKRSKSSCKPLDLKKTDKEDPDQDQNPNTWSTFVSHKTTAVVSR